MSASESNGTVIVGAGVAGLRCAERLRRAGDDRPILLLDAEGFDPYDRPALSKAVLTGEAEPGLPTLRGGSAADLAKARITVRSGISAQSLDLDTHEVVLDGGERIAFDNLVIATGAAARALPNLQGENVHLLRTWPDAQRLRAGLHAGGTVVILGAGVLGLEIAASARQLGLDVHVIDTAPYPCPRFGSDGLGADLERLHRDNGVEFHLGTSVAEVGRDGDEVTAVELADGTVLRPDLVFVAIGTVPHTGWLDGSGLSVDNGVLCDAWMRTSDPAVFVIGDAARVRADGLPAERLEHWTRAGDTAAIAARAIVADLRGEQAEPLTELPYVWTDQYSDKVQILGVLHPDNVLHTVVDEPAARQKLQLATLGDTVIGVIGWNQPAALNKCRAHLANGATLAELLDAAPWVRKAPAK